MDINRGYISIASDSQRNNATLFEALYMVKLRLKEIAVDFCFHLAFFNKMIMFSLQNDEVEFVRTGYGKDMVKVLHIQRDGKYHSIKEVATSVQLTLSSKKDYLLGDNSDIIPTDTMKNTVHVLAKFKGVCAVLLRCCQSWLRSHCFITWWSYLLISSSVCFLILFLHFFLSYFKIPSLTEKVGCFFVCSFVRSFVF